MDTLAISVGPVTGHGMAWTEVRLAVNGHDFAGMVTAFERANGMEPAGGYAPIPERGLRHARDQLLGSDEAPTWPGDGRTVLLICEGCREEGCWPLFARVSVDRWVIRWSAFEIPHRPERDYSRFGPFDFDADAYHRELDRALPSHTAR